MLGVSWSELVQTPFDGKLFASTFGVIFLAELPDKTAFAVLLLASRKHSLAVFLGVAAAYLIQSVVAIALGGVILLLPRLVVTLGAACMFFVFAAITWRNRNVDESAGNPESGQTKVRSDFLWTAWTAFVVIFLAEWGDLTQLATAAIYARSGNAVTVFLAALAALWTASALAILLGKGAKTLLSPPILKRVAATAFLIVGTVTLWLALLGFWRGGSA